MILQASNGTFQALKAPKQCTKCRRTAFKKDEWNSKFVYVCCGCGMVYDPVVIDLSDLFNNPQFTDALAKQFKDQFSIFGLPERYFDPVTLEEPNVDYNARLEQIGPFLDNPWKIKVK